MADKHRKVFLSFLGTKYNDNCNYNYDGRPLLETRFVQAATLKLISEQQQKKWTEEDIAYIFVTNESKEANWQKDPKYVYGEKKGMKKDYKGLEVELKKMKLPFPVRPEMVSSKGDEDGMWEVFNTVFNLLEYGDELYIDITHGFRYLPMLLLVLCNYAKFLKDTTIERISYGKIEGGSKQEIVDLMPLVDLQGWTLAASEFLRSGRTEALVEMADNRIKPILSATKGKDQSAVSIRKFKDALTEVSQALVTVRGREIIDGGLFQKLYDSVERLDASMIPPLSPVVERIRESFGVFDRSKSITNGFVAARWCHGKQLYQQSLTILQETLKAYAAHEAGYDQLDDVYPEMAGKAFNIEYKNTQRLKKDQGIMPEEDWTLCTDKQDELERRRCIVRKCLKTSSVRELNDRYDEISNLRNDFNHAGFRENCVSASVIPDRIEKYINKVYEWIENSGEGQGVRQDQEPVGEPLFVNLSNHPIDKWGEAQLEAALAYGEPVDMPFPEIDPQADEEEVRSLAEEYADRIEESYPGRALTIHVMGEMTFTYYLVELLQQRDIRCVASTTRRLVTEKEDGVKEVRFDFVRFRPYL